MSETTTTLQVSGMTCGHCVGAVTSEVSKLSGVTDVQVTLVPGAVSTVAVRSKGPLDRAQLAEAVDEAGYELADINN